MEEIKEETVLNLCKVKGKCLRESQNKVKAHTFDITLFSFQWKILDKYMESFQGKVKEMFKEFESKEVESSLIDLIVELESLK